MPVSLDDSLSAEHASTRGLCERIVFAITSRSAASQGARSASVSPSPPAAEFAERWGKDPRQVELVLRESAEVLRMADGGLIISRTRQGFVCANAGVDLSNVGDGEVATLLPVDPDASARRLAERCATKHQFQAIKSCIADARNYRVARKLPSLSMAHFD